MRRSALEYLVGTQICGEPVGRKMCLLPPGHERDTLIHSTRWPIGPLTSEQRLERRLAALKAQRDHRQRNREHLKQRVAALERRREWVEGYIGFRIEYRLRGFYRRFRRYYRFTVHRTVQRRDWKRRVSA